MSRFSRRAFAGLTLAACVAGCSAVENVKEALPKRQVRNPGTGEMVWAKPKPAHDQIKVRPLKALKDMV